MTTKCVERCGWALSLSIIAAAMFSAAAAVPAPVGSKSSAASATLALVSIIPDDVEASDAPGDLDGRLYSNEWTEGAIPLNARPPRGAILVVR